jgi:hypothetical protein|tara:strand:- start:110 stop:319 length:210 start_codon:yes stop_codon:yes gene_type:complete
MMENSEWMLIYFIVGVGGIGVTGAFLFFWLYMQERIYRAADKGFDEGIQWERERIFRDSEAVEDERFSA